MVGKLITGSYIKGIFDYADKIGAKLIDTNMLGFTREEKIAEFLAISQLNTRIEKPVKHFMLSFAPQDEYKLNVVFLKQITREYLQKMGITNNQYSAFLHSDTDNSHLHIIVNKVDFSGNNTHISFEEKQSRKVCMELEKEYNLVRTSKVSKERKKQFKRQYSEMEKRLNTNGQETFKQQLKSHIFNSLKGKPTQRIFFSRLNKHGISAKVNKAGNGITFTYQGLKFKGSSLDRDKLSFSAIKAMLSEDRRIPERLKFSDHTHVAEKGQENEQTKPKHEIEPLLSSGQELDSNAEQEKIKRRKRRSKGK